MGLERWRALPQSPGPKGPDLPSGVLFSVHRLYLDRLIQQRAERTDSPWAKGHAL